MGLDMYLFKVKKDSRRKPVDFKCRKGSAVEIAYWRKHPDLHGWMASLYRKKGGKSEDFNLVNLLLTQEDLQNLKQDVELNALPETSGFFFGKSDPDRKEYDLSTIKEAEEATLSGYDVFYTSWW